VATYSTGITAKWGGTSFQEVFDLSYTFGSGAATDRGPDDGTRWSDNLGSVTLSCYGTANTSSTQWGQRKQLEISGGGSSLTAWAVCESIAVQHGVNDVTRFSVTYKLTDS